MTLHDLHRRLTADLQAACVPDASFEAKQLLYAAFDLDATSFLLSRFCGVDEAKAAHALSLARRRAAGEPLQYLLGCWSFLDETFFVGPGVLIPRPETETLTLECASFLQGRTAPVVYDLCAGSGCIGLTLQKRCPDARVFLVEQSDEAMRYLRKNAEKLGDPALTTILTGDVLLGADAYKSLPKADVIVSNPPYIPSDEIASLQREVQLEPHMALDGGADGLLFYRCFADRWRSALKPDGMFAFECGEGQGEAIEALFAAHGMTADIQLDLQGLDRFVYVAQGRKENA